MESISWTHKLTQGCIDGTTVMVIFIFNFIPIYLYFSL